MIPADKEELRNCLSSWDNKFQNRFTSKSIIRIARELKNHIGKEFIQQLESDFEGEYGIEEFNKI